MTPWVVRHGWPPGHHRAGAPGYTGPTLTWCSGGEPEARAWAGVVLMAGGWAEAYPAPEVEAPGGHQRLLPWGVGP